MGQYVNLPVWDCVGALLLWPLIALSAHCSRYCEDNKHHFYSAHVIDFHSCVDIRRSTKFLHQHTEKSRSLARLFRERFFRERFFRARSFRARFFRARFLQQETRSDENHRKPVKLEVGYNVQHHLSPCSLH